MQQIKLILKLWKGRHLEFYSAGDWMNNLSVTLCLLHTRILKYQLMLKTWEITDQYQIYNHENAHPLDNLIETEDLSLGV